MHVCDETMVIDVGGISISVSADYFVCEECGAEYENPSDDYDPLAQAYAEYEWITGKKWKGIYKDG